MSGLQLCETSAIHSSRRPSAKRSLSPTSRPNPPSCPSGTSCATESGWPSPPPTPKFCVGFFLGSVKQSHLSSVLICSHVFQCCSVEHKMYNDKIVISICISNLNGTVEHSSGRLHHRHVRPLQRSVPRTIIKAIRRTWGQPTRRAWGRLTGRSSSSGLLLLREVY